MNYLMRSLVLAGGLCMVALFSVPVFAQNQEHHHDHMHHAHKQGHHGSSHGRPAPAGVMGDHMHHEGGWMFSYRYAHMGMGKVRNGTRQLSIAEVSGDIPNRFAGQPMQPATLRVVPLSMSMDMHMFGAMYAPTDWLTLMGMTSYVEKDMKMVTFSAADPDLELGIFSTRSKGIGDTKLSGLFRLYDDQDGHHVHLKAGLSLPTGAIDREDVMLMPSNMNMQMRLPYGMQLGSGTYDLLPGITYTGYSGPFGWGTQYEADIRLGRNKEHYALGDRHILNLWGSYLHDSGISNSLRVKGEWEGQIEGIDPQIIGASQAANPDFYGGKRIELGLGMNFIHKTQNANKHKFSAELTVPVYQNLNGPQAERDYALILGWGYSF